MRMSLHVKGFSAVDVWQGTSDTRSFFLYGKDPGPNFWLKTGSNWLAVLWDIRALPTGPAFFFFFHPARHQGDIHDMTSWLCFIVFYSITEYFSPKSFKIFFSSLLKMTSASPVVQVIKSNGSKKNLLFVPAENWRMFETCCTPAQGGFQGQRSAEEQLSIYFASVRQQSGVIALKGAGLKLLFYKY